MKVLYKSEFIEISFDEQTAILHNLWSAKTYNMTEDLYRETALMQVQCIKQVQPKRWLIDASEFHFIITIDLQTWADSQFPQILAAGVKYIAFTETSDIVTQISVEQLMEEKNVITANFEIRYFIKKDDAIAWLVSTPL